MKTLGALLILSIGGFVVHHALIATPTVEAAGTTLTHTETDLKEAATATRTQATQLAATIDQPEALPQELQEFNRSTERLMTLRDNLRQDINDYESAYKAKLAEFDQERNSITDAATQRSMTNLRRHTAEDMNERTRTARATLDDLDTVLNKGKDLQHAAKCVLIANDLHAHGEDLDKQLQAAKQAATQYATTTNGLLARVSQALAG